jgi:3-hydroxyisobutyrate dehydrogenase-like beta-hydroxyacid dehydrogenase
MLITDIMADVADKKIGLIGVGRMGTGMGMCLLRHGANLYLKANSNRTGIDKLINANARERYIFQLGT